MMTPDQWREHLTQYGKLHVAHMLQQAPAVCNDEGQRVYARVLASWLAYEGPCPPPLMPRGSRSAARPRPRRRPFKKVLPWGMQSSKGKFVVRGKGPFTLKPGHSRQL